MYIATRNDEEKDEEEVIAETVVPSEEQRRNNVDKYDQYGAFLASTLRDMPEQEAKKKMKNIMLILLDDSAK
ncbi:hypothetical protein NECAME_11064 [Necator americanus]|uniref:BESS domain-containing protein n=1 Tax=Necator americanus TaxID=51031 RepID=W2T894_NECAM|nr:hypothetical protein NECAME_11064 [Necator americanus]ETN77396.1 hypothetical protein NECAME_11064 [Necator americanus]